MKRLLYLALMVVALLAAHSPVQMAWAGTGSPDGPDAPVVSYPRHTWSEEFEAPADPTATFTGYTLTADSHSAYVKGSGGKMGDFSPEDSLTRGQIAQILLRLLPADLPSTAVYSDVPADAWYAKAAGVLGGLGVIRPGEDTFLPEEEVTRGELIRYIACFFPFREDAEAFTDVPDSHLDAPYILSARANGWLKGYSDGTVRPDQPITRAEAVTMLNRALDRKADKAYIDRVRPTFYLDVPVGSWYYYDVMEASVAHVHLSVGEDGKELWREHTGGHRPEEGFHLVDGWSYYYDSTLGDIVRGGDVGTFTFDEQGHYTTGSAELDGLLREAVLAHTNKDMTREEMLRALYNYSRDDFRYLKRPTYDFGATGFMQADALEMMKTHRGNCYSFASVFYYLARWIGYDAVTYSGTLGRTSQPHSWVEIEFDGTWYVFDPELENAYRTKYNNYNMKLYKYLDNNYWRYIRPDHIA